MADMTSEKWINFFSNAGIPARAAATYAVTFAGNRIQLDMLLDLNKEYLRDMGITLMGDVIAILRHARQVHEELTHEKLLSSAKSPSSSVKPVSNLRENTNNNTAPKLVKNSKAVKASPNSTSSSSYTSSSSSQSSSPPSPQKKITVPSRITDPKPKQSVIARTTGSSGGVTYSQSSTSEKKTITKSEPPTQSLKRRSGEISRPKPIGEKPEIEEIPVPIKKVRRVLPEHEGGYKIKMPSGSTPRSQEILAKQKELVNKKTVFDRLGRSSSPGADPLTAAVSSTTSDPTFAITGLENSKKNKTPISSVFSRLGDKQVSSSSVMQTTEETAPFAGILKNTVPKPVQRPPISTQRTSSMVADSLAGTNRVDVQSRIGAQKEVKVVKRSATLVSVPKAAYGVKRTATIVSVPKPSPLVKRTATIISVPKSTKLVKTEGILAGNSGSVIRSVKSRLGADDVPRVPPVSNLKQLHKSVGSSITQRIDLCRPNGSVPQSSSKKVTFSGTSGKVPSRTDVFSRLGR